MTVLFATDKTAKRLLSWGNERRRSRWSAPDTLYPVDCRFLSVLDEMKIRFCCSAPAI
jgi:hypothetical protein